MYTKFQSFIENDIWEYQDALLGQAILTSCWIFKIQKDRWGKILKLKTWWVAHEYKQ